MSTEIYLKTGELSSRTLRKAIDETEGAYKKTEKAVDEALMYYSYTIDGNVCYLFPVDATNQLLSASSILKNALNMLNSLKTILDSGPEALAEIDSGKKNDLTNWWQRTTYSVGVGVAAGTAWIKNLFTSGGGGKTGAETVVSSTTDGSGYENQEPCTEEKTPAVVINENSNYQSTSRGHAIIPPKTNSEGNRSKEAYREVMDALEVETNPRYDNTRGSTYCNIYVWDVTSAMGCEIPHWVDGHELNADGANQWLADHGAENGWIEIDEATALQMANEGYPTVACSPGHIAMVSPSEEGDKEMYGSNIYLSQAGAIYNDYNGNNSHIPGGYVFWEMPVKYYYHK